MPSLGFEPTFPAIKWAYTNALDRTATGIGVSIVLRAIILLTYILTYLPTYSMQQSPSWEANRFSASQEIPRILWNPKVHTAFTSARHLSLSWASSIQSIPPHPTSWRSILILSSHLRLGLPSGPCLIGFPTKTLYTPLLFPIRATCPAHLIILDLITWILQGCW